MLFCGIRQGVFGQYLQWGHSEIEKGTGQMSIWDRVKVNWGRSEIGFYYVPERRKYAGIYSFYGEFWLG